MTIEIPDRGDGSRRQRRREQQRSARRLAVRALLVVLGAAVIAGLAWVVVDLVGGGDDGGARGGRPSDGDASDTAGPSLVVLTDDAGEAYGITVLVPSSSTILHVPPGTLVEVPSLGLASLRDATRDGGVELLQQSLENLFGVSFQSEVTLGPAEVASAVDAVGGLEVSVDDPVEEVGPTGRVSVVVPAGAQQLRAADAVQFLSVVGNGTSLQRLVRHQAFWSAYLDAVGDEPSAALGPVAPAVADLAGETVRHTVLPVEAVSGVSGDEELYRVDDDALTDLVGDLFGVTLDRIRVQILNGVGEPGIAQLVQPLLVPVGGRVTLSGNADRFDYATTQVVYYDDAQLSHARSIQEALGVGEIVKSLTGLDVVDVTVVVGADFVSAHPGG